jgi:arsenite methyltransferase
LYSHTYIISLSELCSAPAKASAVGDLLQAVKLGDNPTAVLDSVKTYYGETLKTSADLKTSACCTAGSPDPIIRKALAAVPDEVKAKYYGCGSPFPFGIQGLRVLDLGCGSGRDCYVCAAMVGPEGSVTGVDMTVGGQLEVAVKYAESYCRDTLGYAEPNMRFVEGKIEDLAAAGIKDESIDLIISNCVVNLSPDKAAVLEEAYRVLAPGGEMYFSDVYCDRRLPAEVRTHPVLLGECLGGALYDQDFLRLARAAGFEDPRRLATPAFIEIKDKELGALLGSAKFYSITYRLFKLPGSLESLCEDYGQAARYNGSIPGHPHSYVLDDHHEFQAGKWYEVCGNSAAMVGDSWLGKYFDVIGDRSTHYGLFDCGEGLSAGDAAGAASGGGACC